MREYGLTEADVRMSEVKEYGNKKAFAFVYHDNFLDPIRWVTVDGKSIFFLASEFREAFLKQEESNGTSIDTALTMVDYFLKKIPEGFFKEDAELSKPENPPVALPVSRTDIDEVLEAFEKVLRSRLAAERKQIVVSINFI